MPGGLQSLAQDAPFRKYICKFCGQFLVYEGKRHNKQKCIKRDFLNISTSDEN
jgi:hypothetical protein